MPTILLTGFEPFGGDAVNPSGEAVQIVASRWRGSERLVTAVLPVTFSGAAARLCELLAEHRPDVVIATGLAGGRAAIGVERVAVNLVDARIPDNDGAQPVDEPSVPGAATAHLSTLPVKEIARRIASAGIPAEVSYSAGTFVCNHVFFTALEAAASGTRAGFIHVPWSTEHAPAGSASLPLDQIADALDIAVRTSFEVTIDATVPAGTLH
ncbi:pyroglutamyl-peptidase I [Microbacterium sp. M3]|uniref:Pyroglutamyl-peptidase I n=1 Tax=Microbacterium arthrosphaerae TaxID=792652 RepID=A0ABU4H1H8_9MICO|nr:MULTISPECIES: pyroglutamyl-peptidase I [Microbacterium]MDW4573183.1 pyroglutamyl-peptidase I [Microbacterium arthrosphaerae]MDW7607038.1 pyroglutamyl-peptidase I [Microbacterium sp. M3]